MSLSPIGPQPHILPDIQLKSSVNKAKVSSIIEKVETTGTITKAEFKKLAGSIEGGKEKLGELLKDVIPADDIKKLKAFTFSRDGNTVTGTLKMADDTQKAEVKNRLGKILDKLPEAKEDTSFLMLNRMQGVLSKPDSLTHKGDFVEKSGFLEVKIEAAVGLSNAAEGGSPADWALNLTDTELGFTANAHLRGTLTVKSEALEDNGPIKLTFEGKFGGGVEAGGGIKSLGVGFSGKGGADISFVKTVSYEFKNKAEALEFLKSEGKGFAQEGTKGISDDTKTFKRTSVSEMQKEASGTLDGNATVVPTKRTTKSFFGSLFATSKQSLTASISSSESTGTTKTYSLTTKSGFSVVSKMKTATEISINEKGGKLSAQVTLDIDLNKITNNSDKEALVKKLTDRFKLVQAKLPKDVQMDSTQVETYIKGTIEKLLKNDGNKYFTPEGSTASPTINAKKDLGKLSTATSVDISAAAPTPVGIKIKGEVHANWGNMVRIVIPLEAEDSTQPKKLSVKGDDSIVQIFNNKGGSIGGGIGFGQQGLFDASATGMVGFAVKSARRLTIASKNNPIPQTPLLVVPTPTTPTPPSNP